MDRSESILALAKLLNSENKRVPILVSKPKSEPASITISEPASITISEPKILSESEYSAKHYLEQIFLRNGYLRIRNRKKKEKKEKKEKQKNKKRLKLTKFKPSGKGYEVRLIPKDREELEMIRTAISELGLNVSNTFLKHDRIVQPIYRKQITLEFQKLRDNYRANNLKNGK